MFSCHSLQLFFDEHRCGAMRFLELKGHQYGITKTTSRRTKLITPPRISLILQKKTVRMVIERHDRPQS